eukprot:scaffold674_cov63-Cyclotella_meneghiniana.AAC.14
MDGSPFNAAQISAEMPFRFTHGESLMKSCHLVHRLGEVTTVDDVLKFNRGMAASPVNVLTDAMSVYTRWIQQI